jgi:hypothetical protein
MTGAAGQGRSVHTLSRLDLPRHVIAQLEAEGVTDLESWRKLGRRRLRLFGITRATAALLDAAARGRSPGARA